jgi:phosphonate transport system substrate-binding protein
MPAALRERLRNAFLGLSPDTADGKEILSLQRASRFVPTRPENYQGIEAAARSAGLL